MWGGSGGGEHTGFAVWCDVCAVFAVCAVCVCCVYVCVVCMCVLCVYVCVVYVCVVCVCVCVYVLCMYVCVVCVSLRSSLSGRSPEPFWTFGRKTGLSLSRAVTSVSGADFIASKVKFSVDSKNRTEKF